VCRQGRVGGRAAARAAAAARVTAAAAVAATVAAEREDSAAVTAAMGGKVEAEVEMEARAAPAEGWAAEAVKGAAWAPEEVTEMGVMVRVADTFRAMCMGAAGNTAAGCNTPPTTNQVSHDN
jgi:hypothetical protein